jgi:hypothetical protein
MIEILKTLRDTPLPSILVVGGLVFLLLPFLKKTGGAIEIESTNKGVAAIIGIFLLASGIGLYILPLSAQPVTGTNNVAISTSQPTQGSTIIATATVKGVTSDIIVSLKYDETAGVHLVQGQTQLVATYLRQVQGGGSLEEAIQSIKQQAANAHATIQEGNTITVQMGQAYFVWCPTADCIYPANTSFPLQGFRQDYLKVAVIEVGKDRVVQCPSTCWAVAVH